MKTMPLGVVVSEAITKPSHGAKTSSNRKRLSWLGCALLTSVLLLGTQPARGEDWSLDKLMPFSKKNAQQTRRAAPAKPSLITQLDTGTKRLFAGAKDLLTFKNPFPKPKPPKPLLPWQQPSGSSRQKKKKPDSILTSWFQPKKPEAPKTLDEFMELKRMDF